MLRGLTGCYAQFQPRRSGTATALCSRVTRPARSRDRLLDSSRSCSADPEAPGSLLARGVGDPEGVAQAVSFLAVGFLREVEEPPSTRRRPTVHSRPTEGLTEQGGALRWPGHQRSSTTERDGVGNGSDRLQRLGRVVVAITCDHVVRRTARHRASPDVMADRRNRRSAALGSTRRHQTSPSLPGS